MAAGVANVALNQVAGKPSKSAAAPEHQPSNDVAGSP
eukprot:CAMPEP_0205934274 /NCGR_PEP_ID=MMETSP1325-20131115/35928_1 /ASSEMBLY_ACC=CAM_ASM_000708 /TAXON_ID=236786 /ORGANISM="Florenciella sp., Strain RCC1007" /LENGTH=36 /DNA_ID= /DNA_START= /DNA_END= /DNA_ORIENTATION=